MSTKLSSKQTEALPDTSSNAFLGHMSEQLSTLIEHQSKAIFEDNGVIIPVRSCSLLVTLARLKSATASDLAKELNQTHQLMMQKIPKLIELGLISRHNDDKDARRKIYRPTRSGQAQLKKLSQCTALIAQAYENLFAEVGDVHSLILSATKSLTERPLIERIDP